MKPIRSELKIIDFAVLSMNFEFVAMQPSQKPINPAIYFHDYELDLDFRIFKEKVIRVIMSVDVNKVRDPLPGYKISAKVATLFQFEEKTNLTAEQRQSIEGFSTIYMALNNLRGILSAFTANAPFGRYTLPSVDLNDLIRKKMASASEDAMQKELKQKTPAKKKENNKKKK
jgi:preprotein translocase subunit SecB